MPRVLSFILVVVCLSCVAQQPAATLRSTGINTQTFDPAHQRPLRYHDDQITATLIVGKDHDSLAIESAGANVGRVDLPVEMAQVDEIRRAVSGKLVVRGMVNGAGSEIAVVDVASAKLLDRFVCYLPSISPDGRYIAFIKFYPAHFTEGADDHYMLYDLARSAEGNRPAGVPAEDWDTVGFCLYPIGVGNQSADNLRRPEGTRHMSRSGFFWSAHGQVAFADQVEGEPDVRVLLVTVEDGVAGRIRAIDQPATALCPEKGTAGLTCTPLVEMIEFRQEPEPNVAVTFGSGSDSKKSVTYDIAKFRTVR